MTGALSLFDGHMYKQSDIFSLLRFIYIVLIYNLVHIICFRNNTKSQNIGKPNNLNIFGSNKTKESKQNGVAFQSYLMFSKEIILLVTIINPLYYFFIFSEKKGKEETRETRSKPFCNNETTIN